MYAAPPDSRDRLPRPINSLGEPRVGPMLLGLVAQAVTMPLVDMSKEKNS